MAVPAAPIIDNPTEGFVWWSGSPGFYGTADLGVEVWVSQDGGTFHLASRAPDPDPGWAWGGESTLPDGTHYYSAFARNVDGDSPTVSVSFSVDTQAPAAPVILSHPAEMVYRQPFTVSGTAEPGTWIMCWAADNNPEMQVLPDGTWSFAFTADDWPPLEDWDPNQWVGNEVSARAYDSAGNYGPTTRVLVEVLPLTTEPEEPEPEPADPNWLLALGIVQALCGGRWTYPALRVVDRLPYPVNGRLRLDGQPLQTVHTVTTSGTAIPFERIGNASIRFAERREGGTFCNPPAEVEVEYTYGWDTLPPRLKAAVDRLAEELTAAETGGACQIPERVMSVSRQGMSWDLIDPMEFLDAGRTGIYEVDLALRTYNPGGSRRKARVFSVDRPPPERIVIAYAHP